MSHRLVDRTDRFVPCVRPVVLAAAVASLLDGASAQCTLRDLVVANHPAGSTASWSLTRQTSRGSLAGFTSIPFSLCTGPGTVQAIEPGESNPRGLMRVLVHEPTATPPLVQSVLYTFMSPFLRSASFPSCPPDRLDFPLGMVVTDIKADQVFAANEAFWFVYLDTNVVPNALTLQRGTTLGPGGSVVVSARAQRGYVSVNEANGTVYVLDDAAMLHAVNPISLAVFTVPLAGGPPITPTDMVYDPVPSAIPGRIIVVGRDPGNPGVGLLQRYTLGGVQSYHQAYPGIDPSSLSVDEAGDYYFLHDGPGGSVVGHVDNRTNTLTPVVFAGARLSAVSWIGRSACDVFKKDPGTRLMDAMLARPPHVGSTSIDYVVTPALPVAGLVFLLSDRFRPSGPLLGPNAEVLVDLTSPNSAVVVVPGTPPAVSLPFPITCALNGTVWHTQFLGFTSPGWLASSLVSFTVGRRPRE